MGVEDVPGENFTQGMAAAELLEGEKCAGRWCYLHCFNWLATWRLVNIWKTLVFIHILGARL